MISTKAVLLQLLWVSLASASHFYGHVTTFNSKKISNGRYEVEIRNKATFRGCRYLYGTTCRTGNCGHNAQVERGVIDSSPNSATSGDWCQTESVIRKVLTSDRPFATREHSCCWIALSTSVLYPWWSILTKFDLGRRSDTNAPNNSPDIAIMPFLRVPQNCRRSYRPIFTDPEGDVVRCRYGNPHTEECADCRRQVRFQVDEATCTLHYLASGNQGVHGFELVVEDYPRRNVRVYYSDGSSSLRSGALSRWKRNAYPMSTTYATTTTTTAVPTTITTTTAAPTTTTTTAAPTTTTAAAPTTTTTTAAPTTTTAAAPTTTTAAPTTTTTTTAAPTTTTTTAAPTTTTTAPTTTTTPGWWHSTSTTTAAPTTTTTTAAPTTTTSTTAAPTTTTTTAAPTTTTTTTAAPTTTTTTAAPTTWSLWTTTTTTSTASPYARWTPPTGRTPTWTTPFSVLPLQFVYEVDPPVPSCVEGQYLPEFVSPTPPHGQIIMAEVGREVEIRVKARARYSTVDHIIMTGPLNITKHRTTGNVFTIRWTPILKNYGHHFPICFIVEFKNGAAVYQTEMRCVLVKVTAGLVNTVVTCKESSMIVEVEKATLPRIHYDHLRLSDPSNTICSLQTHSNSTHLVAIVPLNRCGTQIEEDDDDLIFKNEITTVDSPTAAITRRHEVEIKFFCQYAKEGNVTFTFSAHRRNVSVWDKGFGKLTYGFEFFPNQAFATIFDPRLYPLEYDVGDRIYMEIEATTTVNNVVLFVESCIATPYDTPNYPTTYAIIKDGCAKDSTLVKYPVPHQRMFRFSIEAFKFIGLHDQVFVSCTVMMCEAGNSNTRCSRGCQPNASSRKRREAAIESGTHYVSQGPLRMKRSAEAAGSTGQNLNLNLVFITGCVLAALGMICGVVFYKAKRSSVKYHPLPLEEH